MGFSSPTTDQSLLSQWKNPLDITSLLMIIGGDVVQKSLAAGTRTWWFTPVCFSFGWVSYSIVALINIIDNGCLLPEPDCPVKVINLDSGYSRQNTNWALGRFMRDCESRFAREALQQPKLGLDNEAQSALPSPLHSAIRIAVYKGTVNQNWQSQNLPLMPIHAVSLLCIMLQLGLAAIPAAMHKQWDILMITAIGTLLVQFAGCLPQWRIEKLPTKMKKKAVALTRGNGSHDIVVILGEENCWDLEAFAAPKTPRMQRGWMTRQPTHKPLDLPQSWLSGMFFGFPFGYWLTVMVVMSQSILWLALLVNVASTRELNWILIAIGIIGVFQNGYLAGMERDEAQLNLELVKVDSFETTKVMDGIMDFEIQYKRGKHLLAEFFNGNLREQEKSWWGGDRKAYDDIRDREHEQNELRRSPRRHSCRT